MTNLKRFLTLFFATVLAVSVWGADESVTFSSVYSADDKPTVYNGTNFSVTFDKGTNSNAPVYKSSGSAVRIYGGGYFEVSSTTKTITKIELSFGSGDGTNAISTDVGSYTSNTWTGSASSIRFTIDGTSGHRRLAGVAVTYASGGGGSGYTVTLSKNGSTTDISDLTGTYTLPTTGEHVANACEGWAWHCWANAAYSTGSPTSTAPSSTVITSMTGAGTAYAVYKHEEGSGGSSNVTFNVGTDQGSRTSQGSDAMTKGVITISSTSAALGRSDEYRLYSGSTTTISSSSGNITSIVLNSTASGTSDYGPGKLSGTGYSYSGTVGTWTGNAASVTLTASAQFRATSIVVTIGGGSTTTYTSSPDCAECLTKVTLTKGTPEHGSFSLNKADGAYDNCAAGGLVVTVSGITPADGYQFKEITQTGIASGVTIDQAGKTVTYAKDVAGSSTINVVFELIPTYTVTWNMNGDESHTADYHVGDAIVFPSSADGCDDKTFVGWVSAAILTPTDDEPTFVTSATMPDHNVTYYAVFADEDAGGSGGSTYTLVEESLSDWSGNYIIVNYSGNNKAMKNTVSGGEFGSKDVTPVSKQITTTDNSIIWIFEKGTGDNASKYSVKSKGSGKYAAIGSNTTSGSLNDAASYFEITHYGTSHQNDVAASSGRFFSYYSDGATFRTYSGSSYGVYLYRSNTSYSGYSTSCVPCLTKVTLTKGEESHGTFTLSRANGAYNNCASNFVVTVSGITPESGYYCTGVTATGEHCSVTGPDGSGNYTVTYEMGNAVTSTITANFAPNPTYTVTWSMNGDESNTDSYEEGASIVFPGTAAGCDGKVFRGWSADPVAETNVEPTYVTSATMPAHAVTYYAVYAEASTGSGTPVTLLSEDFSSITNGNSTSTSGSGTSWSGNANIDVNTVYQAGGAIRIGASGSGSIETIALSATAGSTLTVSFDVKGWTNVEGDIRVTVTGCDPEVISYTATMSGSFENKSAQFTLTTDNPTVTIATTAKRAFIDNIVITSGGGTTYSGYTTTCGAGISAQNIGWITSAQGKTVKRVINVSAKNFDDATTLTATCANSNFHLTLGESAVPAGTTGLTTTLTVEYTPTTESTVEANVDITLSAGDKTRTITVSGRSVPDDFLLITKKNDKWYALPANMTSGSGEYDGVEVSPNDATTPTAVPVSPSTLLYNLAPVASSRYAENGNLVRLVGNNNKCLWSNKATTTGKENIQNNAALGESNGDNYEWDLRTDDGIHYYVENPHHPHYASGRRLAYGTKFGMYIEETVFFIVRAGCSSQPGEIVVSPRRVDATFSWVSNTTQMHIDLYTNSEMTEGHLSATASSSPYVFTGLAESTDYWYKLTPGDDTDCAVTGTFKTTGPIIDIVEWQENGVVLFIDKGDINPLIVIDGQEEHGSITGGGGNATELFFSKYFEGSGDMKLVAIFNGTDHDIDLSDYKLYTKNCGTPANESALATSSFGGTTEYPISALGTIKAGHEIVFFTRPLTTGTQANLSACSVDYLNDMATHKDVTDNPRWIECNNSTKYGGSKFPLMQFNGNDAICLEKNDVLIDVIGATGDPGKVKNCANRLNDVGWSIRVKNMDYGKSVTDEAFDYLYEASTITPSNDDERKAILNGFGINIDDEYIDLTTARCILFRDKRVVSGDSAVTMNDGAQFVTCTSHIEGGKTYLPEWNGRVVCMDDAHQAAAGVDDDSKATCNSYKDLGAFNFTEYYIDWSTIDPGQTLDHYTSDPDTKEYTILIDNMRQYACLKLRFQLKLGDEVLTEAAQQVPIVVVGDVDTNDPLFSQLVIDQTTHLPSYSHSVERCKDCDVVVLGSAALTKGSDSDPNDVAEVGNIKVYPGGKLIVPSGTEYTVKSLAFRRQEDAVSTADVQGTLNVKETGKYVYLDFRIDPTNWHYFALPYDCDVSDIRFANEEETAIPVLGTDYLLQWYDGAYRAEHKTGGWTDVPAGATLKKGLGYIVALPGSGLVKKELRFPMSNAVIADESTNKTVSSVYGYGADDPELRPNHKGWNLVGNPYFMEYSSDIYDPLRTGYLEHDPIVPWDGQWVENGNGIRYIVEPIDNGWSGYRQVTMADYSMKPFTCYFVQIGAPTTAQSILFEYGQTGRPTLAPRRMEAEEEDNHPVWFGLTMTAPNSEKDNTTLLISNQFTDDYDMMNDLVKMRGSYYTYYNMPVLASRNISEELAFNALPDASAEAGVPLNYYAAAAGTYTFAYNPRYSTDEIKSAMLYDATTAQYYDLLAEPYSFTTAMGDNKTRFTLFVRVERKKQQTPTGLEDIGNSETPRKILIDGHVYIQRGSALYDVTGKQMLNR